MSKLKNDFNMRVEDKQSFLLSFFNSESFTWCWSVIDFFDFSAYSSAFKFSSSPYWSDPARGCLTLHMVDPCWYRCWASGPHMKAVSLMCAGHWGRMGQSFGAPYQSNLTFKSRSRRMSCTNMVLVSVSRTHPTVCGGKQCKWDAITVMKLQPTAG